MRIRTKCLVGLLFFAFVSGPARADDTVSVDASRVLRSLPATFHGINYVGFWDTAQGSAASRQALGNAGIKLVRFPGGDPADWYDWQCPYYTDTASPNCPSTPVGSSWSSTSPLDVWNYANAFGGSVLFQTNYQGNVPNPPGQSYAANSPENAAAWASYAKAQGMRAMFEIGNEEDIHMASTHDSNFQPYVDAFNAQANAIHAADASAKVFGPVGTNEYYWWALDSLGMFLASAGNKNGKGSVDGVSLHFYKGSSWDDTVDVAQYWQSTGGPWQFIENTIAANDTRALPVFISEWHAGPATTAFSGAMANALVTADLVGAFAKSGVAGHQFFTTHGVEQDPNSWGLLYGANESRGTDFPTPTYYAMALWGRMGDRVLAATDSDDPGHAVSSYATSKADGSVQVLAINKSTADQTVNVAFSGFDPTGSVDVYTLSPTGDRTSKDARFNGVTNPSPGSLPGPSNVGASGGTFTQTVPANSIVLLDFHGSGDIGGGSSGSGGASSGSGGASASGGASSGSGGTSASGGASSGSGGTSASGGASSGSGGTSASGGASSGSGGASGSGGRHHGFGGTHGGGGRSGTGGTTGTSGDGTGDVGAGGGTTPGDGSSGGASDGSDNSGGAPGDVGIPGSGGATWHFGGTGGASSGTGGASSGVPGVPVTADAGAYENGPDPASGTGHCGCRAVGASRPSQSAAALIVLGVLGLRRSRRRR
jgi:MYXO-CTERM domain-containing protein